jgi:penicillin-binding protein 1C
LKNKYLLVALTFILLLGAGAYVAVQSVPGHLATPSDTGQSFLFLDRKGTRIKSFIKGTSYDWIKLAEVPEVLRQLLIQAEDKNFYQHQGIDYKGTLRSAWLNLKSFEVVSGASTISQQVYRISHQTPRSVWGKIQTMIGAVKIENHYTKAEILEFYVNSLPYGKRIAGIKRASEVLLGKELHLLGDSEMATLAILPRSPSFLMSESNRPLLYKKKNALLKEFYALHPGSSDLLVTEEKIFPVLGNHFTSWDNYHFISSIMKEKDFESHIHQGMIETTLDLDLQKEVAAVLKNQLLELRHLRVSHGAVVVLENVSGEVLAYLGTHDMQDTDGAQFDALKIKRQPGSALKPLTYALALQKGWTLSHVLPDIPSYYRTGLGQFLPRNYNQHFSGPRLFREALANSLNLPAVALADAVGVSELHYFYKAMGLSLPQVADFYGVGLTLGNVELTPLELAQVYTSFPNMGQRAELKFFKENESVLVQTPLTEESAYLISDVLSDRVARREEFGEKNPFDLPFEFSVKTGTSTDFRDNWAVGYNQRFTILVWVGNMDQKAMKKVSGITGAGPVLAKVARYLMKDKLIGTMPQPKSLVRHEVCGLSGEMPGVFCTHKKEEFFISGTEPKGTCEYHQEVLVRDCREVGDSEKVIVAHLPDAYQVHRDSHPEWSLDYQVAKICPLEERIIEDSLVKANLPVAIQRPLPGSIFAVDPNIPLHLQKLKVELNQLKDIKSVQWTVNGKAEISTEAGLDWPMEKGKHLIHAEVEFKDGHKEVTPEIDVTVL